MPIDHLIGELVEALSHEALPANLEDEADFERRFVIPTAMRVAARHRDVLMLSHPFGNKRRCTPDCETAGHDARRVIGCPTCWKRSKSWASVAAFGTHHNFDVVAKDSGRRLAVEIKLVGARGGRMPNGELQRFLGQCALAAAKHDAVVGVCACRGPFDARWHSDCATVTGWFARRGVHLVFRAIDGRLLCSHDHARGAQADKPIHLSAGASNRGGRSNGSQHARRR